MRETINKVVNEREALDAAADDLITRLEAATLLLAHYHSDLFGFGEELGGNDVWTPQHSSTRLRERSSVRRNPRTS